MHGLLLVVAGDPTGARRLLDAVGGDVLGAMRLSDVVAEGIWGARAHLGAFTLGQGRA